MVLGCARLRLTRWGESVNIYDDPRLGRPDAIIAEIQVAKDILLQILVLFADTEGISKKYRLAAKAGEDLSAFSTGGMDATLVALDTKMNGLAIKRQNGSRFLKLTRCFCVREVGNTYRRVGMGYIRERKRGGIVWSPQKQWIALY